MREDYKNLIKLCTQVRRDILRMVYLANSGHPGGSMGCTEYFVALYKVTLYKVTLYKVIMNYDTKNFKIEGKNEDLFFLSNGHISPVYYSILSRIKFF